MSQLPKSLGIHPAAQSLFDFGQDAPTFAKSLGVSQELLTSDDPSYSRTPHEGSGLTLSQLLNLRNKSRGVRMEDNFPRWARNIANGSPNNYINKRTPEVFAKDYSTPRVRLHPSEIIEVMKHLGVFSILPRSCDDCVRAWKTNYY